MQKSQWSPAFAQRLAEQLFVQLSKNLTELGATQDVHDRLRCLEFMGLYAAEANKNSTIFPMMEKDFPDLLLESLQLTGGRL